MLFNLSYFLEQMQQFCEAIQQRMIIITTRKIRNERKRIIVYEYKRFINYVKRFMQSVMEKSRRSIRHEY